MSDSPLAPSLLLAMPDLADPNFKRTVVLLVHNDEEGSFGLVLNRPTEIQADDLCDTLGISWHGDADLSVHWGGPVQPNTGWVLAGAGVLEGQAEARSVLEGVHWAGSLEALRTVASDPPEQVRLFLGYAGWGAGQLEREVQQNAWLSGPADSSIIFDLPYEKRYESAARLLGIDLDRLSGEAGHA